MINTVVIFLQATFVHISDVEEVTVFFVRDFMNTAYLYVFITCLTSSPQIWQALSAGQQDKRAPSGFLGMRGKKWGEEGDDDFSLYHKRAPSGFLGMRG